MRRAVACALRQVDSALLGHPAVAEAVSFGAPSEKYGEVVAAAVVLAQQPPDAAAAAADIRKFAGTKLAKFKARTSCLLAHVVCSVEKAHHVQGERNMSA